MAKPADFSKASIKDYLGEQLIIEGFIDEGRDGIVYAGRYKSGPPLELAIKFYVPRNSGPLFSVHTVYPAFTTDLRARHSHELGRLQTLSHPCLQKYVGAGDMSYVHDYFAKFNTLLEQGSQVPFIASRRIHGTRMDEIKLANRSDIARHLYALAGALKYLHQREILHNDIRMQNILIEESTNAPVLVDFGLSIDFSADVASRPHTQLFHDPNPLPKKICNAIAQARVPQGWDRQELRRIMFPFADLHQFGLLIKEILSSVHARALDSFDIEYLSLLQESLTGWEHAIEHQDTGRQHLDSFIFTADELVNRLDRLVGGTDHFRRAFAQYESAPARTIVRRSGTVELRESLTAFVSHPALRRLHNLNQLALLHYVYPSATQSRFDHVLSALGRTQQIWRALSSRPAFLFHMDRASIDRLELASLHHDVNHFPFLHYFQEAGIPAINRASVLEQFLEGAGVARPIAAANGLPQATLAEMLAERGLNLEYLRMLMGPNAPVRYNVSDQIIKSLVNSGVDVDKLAYLPDDAAFSGLRFGLGIDFDGLMAGIDVAQTPTAEGKIWHVVFDEDVLPAVESVCFARYWNFKRLYWHHTNRAMAAMIIWTIRRLYSSTELNLNPTEYFNYTLIHSEVGALEYLARTYATHSSGELAPIDGLANDRDRIYKRIFEKPFTEFPTILTSFREPSVGATAREAASKRIVGVVEKFARGQGYREPIASYEVLLDVPLRDMGLGGRIFIKMNSGAIEDGTRASSVLQDLEKNFAHLAASFRVFVSPKIRDGVGRDVWERYSAVLSAEIVRAVKGEDYSDVN